MEKFSVLPEHIAIIMDGNGRWAKKRSLPRGAGHKAGVEAVKRIVEYCGDLNIPYLTVYAFSTENFKRPAEEVSTLMRLLIEYFGRDIMTLYKKGVKIRILGNTDAFPAAVQDAISAAVEKTKNGTKMLLSIALGYGGRAEIASAFQRMREDGVEEVSEKTISDYLYTSGMPDPDLIIRTSGEERLSNFLLYQAAYSEFYFTDTLWPDFDEKCLDQALAEYEKRHRKFGGL